MGVFDYFKAKNEVVNPTKVDKKKNILSKLTVTNDDRTAQEMVAFREALEYWEDVNNPDRQYLIELYKDIELDGQVKTKTETMRRALMSQKFQFVDAEGQESETSLKFTNSTWFEQFVAAFIGAEMQGFSAFQMIKEKDTYISTLIPRAYVQPDKGFIRQTRGANFGIPLYEGEQKNVLVYIGDRFDFGLFASVAPYYIYKKNALQLWGGFQRKFGTPFVVAKADLTSENEIQTLEGMLESIGSNSWGIVDQETTIEGLSLPNTDGYLTYRNMLDYCDAQISKIMEGQTMTSDDGSSQSQANVHADVAAKALQFRTDRLLAVFNTQVVPFLVRDGFLPEGIELTVLEVEDTNELLDQVTKLNAAGYKVNADWLQEKTNIPLDEIPPTPIENRYGAN